MQNVRISRCELYKALWCTLFTIIDCNYHFIDKNFQDSYLCVLINGSKNTFTTTN